VYFPEYGWIDFDTTVGNDEAEQSPTPDGTPPMEPPKPVMAAAGNVLSVDTTRKLATLHINNLIFKDVEYPAINENITLDMKVARVWKDSIQVGLSYLHKGSDVMAVSYADKLKAFSPEPTIQQLLKKLPDQLPTDEVYIKDLEKENQKESAKENAEQRPLKTYLIWACSILLGLIFLTFLIPTILYNWFKFKLNNTSNNDAKAYYNYKASTLLLHMLKVDRSTLTQWQFAKNVVDQKFGTEYAMFMNLYLKLKYANQSLSASEQNRLVQFFKPFEQKVKSHYSWYQRSLSFLNFNTFVKYYSLPDPDTES
jgi:hypothetical protein